MRVLVTGAFGNLGRAVLAELLRQGHRVRAMDKENRAARNALRQIGSGVDVLWGDIREPDRVREAVSGQDAVIHHAGMLPPATEQHMELARAVNVGGARALIEAMQAQPVRPRLIFPSSVSVFGPMQHLEPPRTASDPVCPTDEYTRHKVECEAMVRASDLPWVILRIGVAPDPSLRAASPEVFRTLFEVSPDARMEFVDRRDVALAQVRALQSREAAGKVLLIGGGPACQIRHRDLFDVVCAALGIEMFPDAAFGRGNYYTDWMDTAESQRILGFQRHSFAEYRSAVVTNMRPLRRLLWPVRPLVRSFLLQHSRPWKVRRALA
jgi:nucleoside-diphosphate-sugar epimerase